jgi:hypothetical protein
MARVTKTQYDRAILTVKRYVDQLQKGDIGRVSVNDSFKTIDTLDITVREYNILLSTIRRLRAGIKEPGKMTLHSLSFLRKEDLIATRNSGSIALDGIVKAFKKQGNIDIL